MNYFTKFQLNILVDFSGSSVSQYKLKTHDTPFHRKYFDVDILEKGH